MLYIGDRHQSIYAFRGAVNAMDDLGDSAKILNLSKTWRFGPKTAEVANLMLGELKAEPLKIIGMGQDAPYIKGACITKLARTNAQLFKDAAQRRGEGIHWVGRASSYNLGRMLEAYYLYANKRDLLKDPFLRHFSSWGEMQAYAEEARDPEVRVMAAIVDEFRHEIPTLVQQIKNNEVENAADASLVLTTAHKSKGLDWDYVQIADDFEILAETEADLALDSKATINEQEINLLYVAATRSRKKLQLNTETQNWLRDLPAHRQARALAAQKEARLQHNKYGVEA
jgi:superfamily I DNA/RNA helicase